MTPNAYKQKELNSITLDDVIKARNKLAKIITEFENGENYLPIFKRLQIEIKQWKEEESLLQEVRKIASKINKEN